MKKQPGPKTAIVSSVDTEMRRYITKIHKEEYNFFFNNCIRKSVKIYKMAVNLGIEVELFLCIAINPKWCGPAPKVCPHVYAVVAGERIEVSLSPKQEKKYWKNSDVKTYLPVKLA